MLVRHEQAAVHAAVHAAQGYARTTGRLGVVFVTSGPGMSNTTTGLLDALCDSVPVLCISGQVATSVIGTDAFQECDALGISRSVTKWNTQLRDARAIAPTVRKAVDVALGGRPGSVLIDFPKDLQLRDVEPSDVGVRAVEMRAPEVQPSTSPPPCSACRRGAFTRLRKRFAGHNGRCFTAAAA